MKCIPALLISSIWLFFAVPRASAFPPAGKLSSIRSDSLRSLRSAPLAHDSWIAPDKFDHLLLSAMLSSSIYLQMKVHHNEPKAVLVSSLGLTLTLGVGKELYDVIHPGHPSWKDLAADAVGALLGALVAQSL